MAPLFGVLPGLPSDIDELTMDETDRLARRRAGQGEWIWSPINVDSLVRDGKPIASRPFMVVFSAEKDVARRIAAWRRQLRIRPLHVSLIPIGGAIAPTDLTVERLQTYCRTALRQAKEANRRLDIQDAREAIDAWRPYTERPSSLRLHSHNVVLPNEIVLISTGERRAEGDGVLASSPEEDYVQAITESAKSVRELYIQTEDRPVYLLSPPRPDVFLFAPAMYKGLNHLFKQLERQSPLVRTFQALERQQGYTLEMEADEADIQDIGNVLSLRGSELKIQSFVVGIKAASTLASTIRLPAKVNRTAGVVRQLARHLRHYDGDPPDVKTARVFHLVQNALRESIPSDHLTFLAESKSGIKIIADAPLEWTPVNGLPLGIRFDVSRINVTPGNLLLEQLRPVPPKYIPSDAFKSYLVTSMFEADDNLAHHVQRSLEALPDAAKAKITGTRATPRTVEEFLAAVNAYDGPILIVDSHGTHPNERGVGGLIIGGKPIDIWSLEGRIKLPPIVVLSACDTHPFDRSHATVANGFLHCGAVAVLATVLPIRSPSAAVFLVRLMLRAISYGNAMNGIGKSAPWTNIVGGALRMQLASDVVRGLTLRKLLPRDSASEIQLSANVDINPPHERVDWLERLGEKCREAGGFNEAQWQKAFDDILAASDVIRYVNIGNPEAILIADERVTRRALQESRA